MASDPTQPAAGRQPDLLGPEEDADIPPPPQGLEADPLDARSSARLQRMERRGRVLPTLLVLVAIGAFAAIVWWAYRTANRPEAPAEVPVVAAEPGDVKVRPESEGGMDVPNQDKLIYEQLGEDGGEPPVERLLPPPEEPLDPPAPPPPGPDTDTADLTPPPAPQEIEPTLDTAAPAAAEDPASPAAAAEAEEPSQPADDVAAAEPATPPAEAPETAPAEPAPAEPVEAAPAAEPTPAPAAQTAAAGSFRVQLASLKSEADAQRTWDQLRAAHADLLGGLQPTIQRADLGDQGIFYRVQGGPLPSREAAAALCDGLKKKDQACLVVAP